MAKNCGCGGKLGNTGSKSCPLASKTRHLIGVPTEAADGTINKIEAGQVIDQAYLTAQLNEADATKRWFPITKLENVTNGREASTFETATGGKKAKTGDGIKTFAGQRWKTNEIYLGKLEEWACTDFSFFIVDKKGNLRGKINDATGDLYPVQVDKDTWDPLYVEPQDDITGKVAITFDWDSDECDSEIRMVTADDITADFNAMTGLLDIQGTISNEATTGFTVKLTLEYGSVKNLIPDTGLLLADFTVNQTAPTPILDIALTSVTETAVGSGVYDVVFAVAEDVADVLQVVAVKAGRDYTAVTALPIVIV